MKVLGRASIAAISISALLAAPASAAVSLTVEPLVAEFNAQPGSTGRIPVYVSNSGTTSERIVIRRTDWRTLADGSTALEKVGAEGTHSITRDLSLSAYQFILHPGERRELSMVLNVSSATPSSPNSYWGGFLVSGNDVDAPPSAVGIAATVFVYNNIGTPKRHLGLQSMRVVTHGGSSDLVARLRNDAQGYCRPSAHLLIGQAGRIVRDEKINVSTVFPNSTRILTQHLGKLPAGDYRVELTLDYGGESIVDGVTQAHVH